ncbi:MAG: hypothetical protein H0W12_10390 [Chitinophagaceae bacterium]|nr:hypothetical protein [Chitinophagaceae bacterium]
MRTESSYNGTTGNKQINALCRLNPAVHIPFDKNIPYSDLQNRLTELSPMKNRPVIIYNINYNIDTFNSAAMLVVTAFTYVSFKWGHFHDYAGA